MAHDKDSYFKIFRSLLDSGLWLQEPFTKGQAWVDLIGKANYADIKKYSGDDVTVFRRGQVVTSVAALATRWKWSRHKVSDFLTSLEADQMIAQKRTSFGTVITVENYGLYQNQGQAFGHQKDIGGTSEGHQKDIGGTQKKKSKKSKKSKEEREGLTPRGPYGRVTLSDGDLERFLKDYPEDGKRYIEELDAYMEQTGKDYRNCLPALYKWAKREADYKARPPELEEPEGGFTFGWANFGKEEDET